MAGRIASGDGPFFVLRGATTDTDAIPSTRNCPGPLLDAALGVENSNRHPGNSVAGSNGRVDRNRTGSALDIDTSIIYVLEIDA
jgi:hypothetical protein